MSRMIKMAALTTSLSGAGAMGDDFSDVAIVDTHIHLYDVTRSEGVPWPPRSDQALYRPVLPKDFDEVARQHGITATVIVEASPWEGDNRWVLDLVRHDPDRYIGFVGNLPVGTPEFAEQLKELSQDERFVGIRIGTRPRGPDYFTEATWRDLAMLAEMDQTLDVLMYDFSLREVAMIAERLPNLRILVNHVAKAQIDGDQPDAEWVAGVKLAASRPNVYCKVSGLFQQSHQTPAPTNLDFYASTLDVVTDAFGEDRLIYGSNWPVTMRAGSYGDYKKIVFEYYGPKGRRFV
ncbi:MAG: amidohydrolase family protein, partial [Planctomycetota bacterium]